MEEKIFIKNKEGVMLAAILHTPKNLGAKKVPAAILLHGFTGYKEETHIQKLAEDLAKNGFVSIRFDASGSGESEGTFEKDYGFENYLEDALSIIEFLKGQSIVDEKKIFLWGHSMGGQLAFWAAHKDKSIKGLCAVSTPSSVARGAGELEGIKNKGFYEKNSPRLGHIKIPYSFFLARLDFDVLKIIKVIKQPKLLIWGLTDTVVPHEMTEEIYEKANEPKEKLIIEGMGHDYKKYPELIEKVNEKVIEFFMKWMK